MGIFSKRSAKPAPVLERVPSGSAKRLTLSEVEAQLKKYRESEIDTLPKVDNWLHLRRECTSYYEATAKAFAKLDLARLTDSDSRTLTDLLHIELPKATEQLAREAMVHWNSNTRTYNSAGEDELLAVQEKVMVIVRAQRAPGYEGGAGGDEELVLRDVTFPRYSFANSELSAALARLEEAWGAACQRRTTVEERYLLHQIATSYLPDSWRMIQGFETYPPELHARVEAHVLEQLTLLSAQVEELLNRNAEVFMGAIEAHTNFLRAKRQQASASALKLSKQAHQG